MDIIVSRGHGNFDAWAATVENAKTILSWQTIPREAVDFAAKKPTKYVTTELVARLIKRFADDEVGTVIETKHGDVFTVTGEAKGSVIVWMYQHKITAGTYIGSSQVDNALKTLECLAPWKDIPVVDEWIAEAACSLVTIQEDRWKVSATEKAKINYILRFVNENCHCDEDYELISVHEKA